MIRRRPKGQTQQGRPFAPYPLIDFAAGLYDAKESFLAPRGAWDVLNNCHVFRGRVQKRKGYARLGELCTAVRDEVLETLSAKTNYTGTLSNIPVCLPAGSYRVEFESTGSDAQMIYSSATVDPGTQVPHTGEAITPSLPLGIYSGIAFTLANVPIVPGTLVIKNAIGNTVATESGLGVFNEALIIGPTNFSAIDYTTGVGWILWPVGKLGPFKADYTEQQPGAGELCYQDDTESGVTLTTGVTALTAQGDITPGTFVATDSTGGTPITFTDDGAGNLTGSGVVGTISYTAPGSLNISTLPGGWTNPTSFAYTAEAGTLDHTTGVYDITFQVNTVGPGDLEADYDYNRGLPVMGLHSFFDRNGNEYTVAVDTRRLFRYNSTRKAYEDVDPGLADHFSGDDEDFPWCESFEDTLRITNGVDPPKTYSPLAASPRVADSGRDFDGDTTDELDTAKIVLRGKDNSLIYLFTKESGTVHPQRARFTEVNDVDYAAATAKTAELYVDCPTEDKIVTAERHGDDYIVGFERSFWRLVYTGQPNLPYEWDRIPSSDGALAIKASLELAEEVITRGRTGLVAVDGVGESPIDEDVPDIALGWSAAKSHFSQAWHSREARQLLFTYAEIDEDYPNKAFVLQYDDKRTSRHFSTYDFAFSAIGEYRKQTQTLWDDLTNLMDSYDFLMDDPQQTAGFPIVLVGDRSSVVYEWGNTLSDAGADITATMRTARLNPEPFYRVHLGYIDLILDVAESAGNSLTINVFGDFSSSPYFSTTLDTSGVASASDGKVKRRIRVNQIASWHQIELIESSKKPLKIDAIVPYFRRVGMMRNVSAAS